MTKILMVCLGNICRSPLAEGILKSKVDSEKAIVDSAGTGGYHVGEPPDPRSIEIANQHGLDISKQRCRKFIPEDFQKFDFIYVMDKSNYANVLVQASSKTDASKIHLLLNKADSELSEVPDPYYGGDEGFKNVYRLIDKACTAIANELNQQ